MVWEVKRQRFFIYYISIMDRLHLNLFEYYELIIEIKGDLMAYMEIEQD